MDADAPGTQVGAPPRAPTPRGGRYQRSASGLVGALLVLVLVITALWLVRGALGDRTHVKTPTVDYAQVAGFARARVSLPLVEPARLPSGWRATSARFTPGSQQSWHIGVLTGAGKYVGLEQARASTASMVREYVDASAVRGGTVHIAGHPWTSYSDDGGDHALVRRSDAVTTLVVGPVDPHVLADYAGSLHPVPPQGAGAG